MKSSPQIRALLDTFHERVSWLRHWAPRNRAQPTRAWRREAIAAGRGLGSLGRAEHVDEVWNKAFGGPFPWN